MPGVWGQSPSAAIRAPPSSTSTQSRPRPTPTPIVSATTGTSTAGGRSTNAKGRGRGRASRDSFKSRRGPNPLIAATTATNTTINANTTINNNAVALCLPGYGLTPQQQQITRYTAETCLKLRLDWLDPPTEFPAPTLLHWTDRGKTFFTHQPSLLGDVSHQPNQPHYIAPPIKAFQPLQVNEDTRWKSKAFHQPTPDELATTTAEIDDQEVLKQALMILNKLSLTTLDKLSDAFFETGIGRSTECLTGAIALILEKAQTEPHFSNMYALLCLKIASKELGGTKKLFKKILLTQCQKGFETDMSLSTATTTTDPEEQQYLVTIHKKKYLGHMKFIGELYKGGMIKIEIMLWCLTTLLDNVKEDEKVECFCKLMSTIGYKLEEQSHVLSQSDKGKPAEDLTACWCKVNTVKNSPQVSLRIKFMLLDLLEMKEKGWISRRKEETAKTIDQIHQEVAAEEAARRSSSGQSLVTQRSGSSMKPVVDADGFMNVVPRAASYSSLSRSVSENAPVNIPPKAGIGRSQSFSVARPRKQAPPPPPKPISTKKFPDTKDVDVKAKSILREYFVSGETGDAVLSIKELVGVGHDGSMDRGAKVIEAGSLLAMEMKEEHVQKMMVLFTQCLKEQALEKACISKGLMDPLELLVDIEIDAPLARSLLATIIAEWINVGALTVDFLLTSTPENFRTLGKPALLAVLVLTKVRGEVTDADLAVVEQLMSDDDKETHTTVKEWMISIV